MKKNHNSSSENIKIESILSPSKTTAHQIPLAGSLLSAGFPSSAENFIERSLDLNELIIKHPTATFFVKVIGDSMINAGIRSGDILVVDRSLTPTHNKIAVVRLNDEFTVKRIHITSDNRIFLVPENQNYKPIEVTKDDDFEIWGLVTFVVHQTL